MTTGEPVNDGTSRDRTVLSPGDQCPGPARAEAFGDVLLCLQLIITEVRRQHDPVKVGDQSAVLHIDRLDGDDRLSFGACHANLPGKLAHARPGCRGPTANPVLRASSEYALNQPAVTRPPWEFPGAAGTCYVAR